jgi:hypothetical protein
MGIGDFKNDLGIRIGALFTGAGAFKNAGNAISKLDKNVKFLAKSYAGLFVAQKAVAFGKASLAEYGKNQTAIAKLTAEVTNLGQAFELSSITKYLDTLEKTFAIQKEELRPAFQELMRVTKSYTVSQKLLRTGLDVSAGSGQSLSTVIDDLNQAYVGNQKGLKKYNLGLTNAELATKSFEEVTALLAKTFSGQATIASTGFEKNMVRLQIASNNVKQSIGEGLVQALVKMSGEGATIDDLTRRMENFGAAVGRGISKVGDLLAPLVKAFDAYSKLSKKMRDDTSGRTEAARRTQAFEYGRGNMPDMSPQAIKNIKQRQQLEKESLARSKQLAALSKKQTGEERARLALQKAQKALTSSSKVFDIDLIQNIAALQGKLTDDEVLRLQTQQAILTENAELAGKLSQKLLSSQIDATILASASPFDSWTKGAILALEAMIKLRAEVGNLTKPILSPGEQVLANDYIDVLNDANDPSFTDNTNAINDFLSGLSNMPSGGSAANYQDAFARPNAANSYNNVVITIDPTAAQYGINAANIGASANGNSNNYSTIQSFKGGTGF